MSKADFFTETGLGYKIVIPIIFWDFKIIKDINKGAYSSVVQVEDLNTNIIYAAKIIPKLSIENKSQLHLINKEIDILSNITHPNIVKLFSTIELTNDKKEEFIILIEEFCPNGSLLNYVNTEGFKNKKDVRLVSRGITEAIKYLHDEGIAHCDIKPENILLTKDNVPKLCDFNLSKYINNADQTDRSCTLAYSAPEIHICKPIDFLRADIWSLGITLFAISELRLPYGSIYEALNGKLIFSSRSKLLDSFSKKCLNHDPLKRLSAEQLLKDPYLTIDDTFIDDYDYDTELILKSKQESIVRHQTSPKLNHTQKVTPQPKKKVDDDDDQPTNNDEDNNNDNQQSNADEIDDVNITLELGFDFQFQNDENNSSYSQSIDQSISNYLELNYSELMSDENSDIYEIERFEDRICDSILKVKYQKKFLKDKKKERKNKM